MALSSSTWKSKGRLRVPLLLCACIATSGLLQTCGDRRVLFYPSLTDAIKAGEIDRGWIPDYLPASSHAIHIIYDPASPRTWCAFEFSPTESQGLKRNLTNVNALPEALKRVDSPGASWWPDVLKGDLDTAKLRSNGLDAYVTNEIDVRAGSNVVLFAIDWTTGRGFFYRSPVPSSTTGRV